LAEKRGTKIAEVARGDYVAARKGPTKTRL